MAREPLPLYLSHRPLIAVEYESHDGPYAPAGSDAQHMSLGTATWNQSQLSVKVFRHTGEKWSRESEELPLWRPIDMVVLEVLAMMQIGTPPITVPRDTFHQQPDEIKLEFRGSPMDLYAARQQLADPLLMDRLETLRRLLNRFRGHQPELDRRNDKSDPTANQSRTIKVSINDTTIDIPADPEPRWVTINGTTIDLNAIGSIAP